MADRQASNVDAMASDYQRTWHSMFHWRGMASMLLGTPGLRAAWPMSSVDFQQPECTDISAHGNHLQAAAALGNVTFGQNGISPIAVFGGGVNQYLLKVDAGAGDWADITGGEVQIQAADRGLTLGGWFWWSALPGAVQFIMGKDNLVGGQQAYRILLNATNIPQFVVWPGSIVVNASATIVTGWNHVAGIYDQPSQTLFIELNGVVTAGGAGAAPAALADTIAPFTIGADGAGGNRFTGYGSDCILSAASLPLGFVGAGFEYTKAAYGVK